MDGGGRFTWSPPPLSARGDCVQGEVFQFGVVDEDNGDSLFFFVNFCLLLLLLWQCLYVLCIVFPRSTCLACLGDDNTVTAGVFCRPSPTVSWSRSQSTTSASKHSASWHVLLSRSVWSFIGCVVFGRGVVVVVVVRKTDGGVFMA